MEKQVQRAIETANYRAEWDLEDRISAVLETLLEDVAPDGAAAALEYAILNPGKK